MSFEDPTHWPYWVALIVSALGGGAGLRMFFSKVLKEIGKASDAINTLPCIIEDIKKIQDDLSQIRIGELREDVVKVKKKADDNESVISAFLATCVNGIMIFNDDGKLVWANQEAAHLSGCSRTELIGDYWKSTISAEDHPRFISSWELFVDGRSRKFETEFSFSHPEGGNVKVQCRASKDTIASPDHNRIVMVLWKKVS